MDVAVDDTVYFTKYAPDEIEVAGKEYLIIKVTSILAKEA
jgi:co-chaperonin GroES (HSP10)